MLSPLKESTNHNNLEMGSTWCYDGGGGWNGWGGQDGWDKGGVGVLSLREASRDCIVSVSE